MLFGLFEHPYNMAATIEQNERSTDYLISCEQDLGEKKMLHLAL